MSTFFDLEPNRLMSLEAYAQSIDNPIRGNMVTDIVTEARKIFSVIAFRHGSPRQIPDIRIINDATPSAQGMEGLVYINEGLINHCLSFRFPYLGEILPESPRLAAIDHSFMPSAMLIWVMAHEFFHVVRAHNEVLSNVGEDTLTLRALEHDADLCAVAELYRHFQALHRSNLSDQEIRSLTLYSIFWPLRTLAVPKQQVSHSAIGERIWHILTKLAIVVEQDTVGQVVDIEFSKQESKDALSALLSVFIACEQHYVSTGAADNSTPGLLVEWKAKIDTESFSEVVKEWDSIRDLVAEKSKTRA